MSELQKALPMEGWAKPAQNPKKLYRIDRRDRLFLILALFFSFLLADTFLWHGPTSFSMTLVVFAWYAMTMTYTGPLPLLRRSNCVLLLFNLFFALTMTLQSNGAFQLWNRLVLLVLLPVQTLAFSSAAQFPWWRPVMLWERILLFMWGLFGHLGAASAALHSGKKETNSKHLLPIIGGSVIAVALVSILIPILASADALFAAAASDFCRFVQTHFTETFVKLVLALVLTPFAFSLLYSLRHPTPPKGQPQNFRLVNGAFFVTILATLDLLYLLFLSVQSAGLFGGPEYLAQKGVSYAAWARSGFFQMVGVTVVNLTVTLTALSASHQEGLSWKVLRLLAALLSAESLVLLASAAWRMTLYVSAYGLSFKRFLTYWGMVMMALFLLTALWKIHRPDFHVCRAAFPLALAGWLVINCIPVDYLVAKNQVDRYLNGESETLSVEYLVSLSYDTLHQLERLSGMTVLSNYSGNVDIDSILSAQRKAAAQECSSWHTWSLSTWLAAGH